MSKVIFISGAARGLGAYLANELSGQGDRVYCASRSARLPLDAETSDRTLMRSGVLDVTDYESCESAIADCLRVFGRIDILINNAASFLGATPIGQFAADDLRREVETTLLGSMNLTNAFVAAASNPDVRQHIVCIASTSGLPGESGNGLCAPFAAAKAGLIRFAEVINETTVETNISSHVLVPTTFAATI